MIFNKLKNNKIKNKIIALILFLAGYAFLLFFFIFLPSLKEMQDLKEEIVFLKKNYEIKTFQSKNIAPISDNIAYVEKKIGSLDGIYVKKNNELEFITILENLALKNNLNQKIDFTPPVGSGTGFKSIPLNLDINGHYNGFISYLNSLESLPYYINIIKIEITGRPAALEYEEQKAWSTIQAKITAETHWQ